MRGAHRWGHPAEKRTHILAIIVVVDLPAMALVEAQDGGIFAALPAAATGASASGASHRPSIADMLLDEPSEDEYGGNRKRRAVAVDSAAESHYARMVQECLGVLPRDVYENILAAITTFDSNLKKKRSIR